MRTDMRAELEALLDEYRVLTARLGRMQADLASLTATARSADGSVTATVRPHGELVGLLIDEVAARRLGARSLASRIVEAAGLAAADARKQVGALVADHLPDRLGGAIRPDGTFDISSLLPSPAVDLDPPRGGR